MTFSNLVSIKPLATSLFTFLVVSTISAAASASSITLVGSAKSKGSGEIKLKLKLTNPDFAPGSNEVVPKTELVKAYDNGQFESADCVTTATFDNVVNVELQANLAKGKQIALERSSLSAIISNSYPVDESEVNCDASPLNEVRRAKLVGTIFSNSMPIRYLGKDALLEVNLFEMSHSNDVNVSGDENRMSFDGMNFDLYAKNGKKVYYQIVQRSAGGVSTLEAGWIDLSAK